MLRKKYESLRKMQLRTSWDIVTTDRAWRVHPISVGKRMRARATRVQSARIHEQQFRGRMDEAGRLQDSIVLIHGDLGSPLGFHAPLPGGYHEMSVRDFRDGFATSMVVKLPAQTRGADLRARSMQVVFGQALAGEGQIQPSQSVGRAGLLRLRLCGRAEAISQGSLSSLGVPERGRVGHRKGPLLQS